MGTLSKIISDGKKQQQSAAQRSNLEKKYGSGTVEAYERNYGNDYSQIDSFSEELKDKRETNGSRQTLFGNRGSIFGN